MPDRQSADILSVEDDELTIVGIISELANDQIAVDISPTIDDARLRLRDRTYRLLLIDLRIPETNEGDVRERGGVQLLKELKAGELGERNRSIKFIILTAQSFLLDRMRLEVGNGFLRSIKDADCLGVHGKGSSIFPLIAQIKRALGRDDDKG